jgi:hypothetical protein
MVIAEMKINIHKIKYVVVVPTQILVKNIQNFHIVPRRYFYLPNSFPVKIAPNVAWQYFSLAVPMFQHDLLLQGRR